MFWIDPHDEVRNYAQQVIDFILWKLNESQLGDVVAAMEDYLLQKRSSVDMRSNKNGGNTLEHGKTKDGLPRDTNLNSIQKNSNNRFDSRRVQSMNLDNKGNNLRGQDNEDRSSFYVKCIFFKIFAFG